LHDDLPLSTVLRRYEAPDVPAPNLEGPRTHPPGTALARVIQVRTAGTKVDDPEPASANRHEERAPPRQSRTAVAVPQLDVLRTRGAKQDGHRPERGLGEACRQSRDCQQDQNAPHSEKNYLVGA
jgi:hypothetical protein